MFSETQVKIGEYAEDLAATMHATTLGIEFDVSPMWQEREQIYNDDKRFFPKNVHRSSDYLLEISL